MRNLTSGVLTKVQQRLGSEPLLIVGVKWEDPVKGQEYLYGDKARDRSDTYGFSGPYEAWEEALAASHGLTSSLAPYQGKVLEISGIEDVTKVSGAGSSSQVSVKLDDTDGSIKKLIDTHNPHKKPVVVYQGFEGTNEKFPIYEGEINTPIVWSEADRTITFEVVTKIEDRDVGFSAEEGQFPNLPDDAIGKVWPLAFGDGVNKVPGLTFQINPVGTTTTNVLVPDRTYALIKQYLQMKLEFVNEDLSLILFYQVVAEAAGDQEAADGFKQQSIDVQEAANKARADNQKKMADLMLQQQQYAYAQANLLAQLVGPVTQGNTILLNKAKYFPQDTPIYARVGEFVVHGTIHRDVFTFILVQPPLPVPHPYKAEDGSNAISWIVPAWTDADIYIDPMNVERPYFNGSPSRGPHGEVIPPGYSLVDSIEPEGLRVIPAGSAVTLIGDVSMDYIVNIIPTVVNRVWVYKSVNQLRQLYPIPTEYWVQTTTKYGDHLTAQVVRLKRPLSGYAFENWEDQIYVDQTASVGPNFVDVIAWLIGNYTTHGTDDASFAEVRGHMAKYPCNFYLNKRGNILAVLSEMAYQARCAIWLKNGVFFIRYLPVEREADDTITEDEIAVGSMSVSCTDTEELVMKIRGSFETNYALEKPDLIIVRANIDRYGLIVQDDDYYIWTDPVLAQKTATYWIIRRSNTWKRITFKTFLNHLNLETYDVVNLAFSYPWVCSPPNTYGADAVDPASGIAGSGSTVKGLVESAVYDSVANDITLTCWLPILFGEMTQHPLAWPGSSDVTVFFPFIAEVFEAPQRPTFYSGTIAGLVPVAMGGGVKVNVIDPPPTKKEEEAKSAQGEAVPSDADDEPPDPPGDDPQPYRGQRLVTPKYDYTEIFKPDVVAQLVPSSSVPGFVVSKNDDGTYVVDTYPYGTGEKATRVKSVRQLQIADNDTIPPKTACLVSKVHSTDGKKTFNYMQVPVWLA